MHKEFRRGAAFNYDFAIVRLSRDADFAHDWIRPACLPSISDLARDYSNTTATVSGWGVTSSETRRQSTSLQAIKVNISQSPKWLISFYVDQQYFTNPDKRKSKCSYVLGEGASPRAVRRPLQQEGRDNKHALCKVTDFPAFTKRPLAYFSLVIVMEHAL